MRPVSCYPQCMAQAGYAKGSDSTLRQAPFPAASTPRPSGAGRSRRSSPSCVIFAIAFLAPGLGEVRDLLSGADPLWLTAGVALEGLSFASYILMFRPIFCRGMTRRRGWQIAGSELAMGSLVPASGAAVSRSAPGSSTALGWIRGGSPGARSRSC